MTRRVCTCLFFFIVLTAILPVAARAQAFPDSVYAWRKIREEVLPQGIGVAGAGASSDLLEAYGVSEWRVVEYILTGSEFARAGRNARIDVATLPSRERAYGLFRQMADNASPEGIIGDALGARGGIVHVNYGPFYFRISTDDQRGVPQVDEALIARTRRLLYGRADCFGSDFPLPTEERVIGSERYFPPDLRAWRLAIPHGTEDIQATIGARAAFVAEYRKPRANVRRTVLQFPFRGKEAAADFAAELAQQLETRAGARRAHCTLSAFSRGRTLHLVAAAPARVLLVVTDVDDTGCCDWLRDLLRGQ